MDNFIEKTHTRPIYRAVSESVVGGVILYLFAGLWGGTLGLVIAMMLLYVCYRGYYLVTQNREEV